MINEVLAPMIGHKNGIYLYDCEKS